MFREYHGEYVPAPRVPRPRALRLLASAALTREATPPTPASLCFPTRPLATRHPSRSHRSVGRLSAVVPDAERHPPARTGHSRSRRAVVVPSLAVSRRKVARGRRLAAPRPQRRPPQPRQLWRMPRARPRRSSAAPSDVARAARRALLLRVPRRRPGRGRGRGRRGHGRTGRRDVLGGERHGGDGHRRRAVGGARTR